MHDFSCENEGRRERLSKSARVKSETSHQGCEGVRRVDERGKKQESETKVRGRCKNGFGATEHKLIGVLLADIAS